jgi:hypothetical protein
MEMTEFTKTKMHFALALLGTLFAVHPFVEKVEHAGFTYLGWRLEVFHAYGLTAALLAVAIYCYAAAMVSERPGGKIERTGNYFYAISMLMLPLYGGLYVSHLLEQWLNESHLLEAWLQPDQLAYVGPMIAAALGIFWVVAGQLIAWRLRGRLGAQDNRAKVDQLAEQEINALNRASEMLASGHNDLGVIEAWKALESRLRRTLLLRGMTQTPESADALIAAAIHARVLQPAMAERTQEVRKSWQTAVSPEPLPKEAAEKSVQAVRDILSTIPLPAMDAKAAA